MKKLAVLFIISVFFVVALTSNSSFATGGSGPTMLISLAPDSPKGQIEIGGPSALIRFNASSQTACTIKDIEFEIVGTGTGGIINDFLCGRVGDSKQQITDKALAVNYPTIYYAGFPVQPQMQNSFWAGGTIKSSNIFPLRVVIRDIIATNEHGNEMKVEGLPLFGNLLTFANNQICPQGQIGKDGQCFSALPPDPPSFPTLAVGFPESGDFIGIRPRLFEKGTGYYASAIPIEINRLVAEKSVELHIHIAPATPGSATPDFEVTNIILNYGLKDWVMVSEIKPMNVHILVAGPRQIGDPHATTTIVYLSGKGAGKYKATINAKIDDALWHFSESVVEYHMKGDMNGDLKIGSADAIIILKDLLAQKSNDVGSGLTPMEVSIGNVNDNGKIDIDDVIWILKYSVGIISSFDQLSMGAPAKVPKNFSVIVKELADEGADPEAISLLKQLTPVTASGKLAKVWGGIKSKE